MRFESPWAFVLFVAVPGAVWLQRRLGGRASLRFSSTRHAGRSGVSLRQRLLWVPVLLRFLALALLILGLARPQQGRERVRDLSKGIAIEMVVDRSSSMQAEMRYRGEQLNRLEVVKRVFEEFVTGSGRDLPGRPNDLIGMIAFARYPDTICPLTLAHGALSQFLEGVQLVRQRSEDGTAIGDAVALAAARLKTAEQTLARQAGGEQAEYEIKSKIIILLTDGSNNAGKRTPRQAAELAAKWGIKIYAIGVGGEEAVSRMPGLFGNFMVPLGARVDERTLRTMAELSAGIFRMADDAESLQAIYKEIDEMERSEIESIRYMDYRELFVPFALTALLLLVCEVVLNATVFRRVP